ncbi:hypothetical protein AB1L88_06195 [Tautonia sp. JC769]|uniref:hypothetical protein n=1 Tax=Tautonia sp. JC769 TaxID=3232135 RepID=UPI00345A179F
MVIWSGWGFLVGVITFGCLIATEFLVEEVYQDEQFYQANGWPKLAGFLASAVIVGVVGRWIGRKQGRVLIDPETGEEVRVGGNNTFFFIPMEKWAPILLVLGVIFLFVTD